MKRTRSAILTAAQLDDGFSVAELVVASLLVLIVVAGAVALAVPATETAHAQPEAIELQQRVRAAATALFRDMYAAGAGLDRGVVRGPLQRAFAAVLPRRIGAEAADAPETARGDVVSLVWVPDTVVQTTVVAPFATSPLTLRDEPGCPSPQTACSARAGMGMVVFDRTGTFNLFTVESVTGPGVVVRPRGGSTSHPYGDDAAAAEVEARTYYLDPAARQLRQYDTDRTDVPVLDEVVGFTIEYFGTSAPPIAPRPPIGTANCLYGASGAPLSGLSTLPIADNGLAALPLAMLADGPWCGSGGTRYDADLLRVRRLRVSLRLQVAAPELRGADSRFAIPGTATSATRTVPDVTASFDVAPRNLELPR